MLGIVFGLAVPAYADPSGIVSDSFNSCTVDSGLWQIVDPKGDATIDVVGTGSADARISISFPAGTKHDVWSNANDSARLMQPANNTDFVIAAKFDAPMSASYQMQGILVEQSVGTFLRFDFYGAGNKNYIFAAAISGSSVSVKKNMNIAVGSPLYMSITRAGDVWTQKYSYDGVTWQTSVTFTYAMTVTAVGPFVGNYNAAFTGLIDYFFNSASPIAPEDGQPAIPPAVLTTNVIGQGSIEADPDQLAYYCDETVVLSAIAAPGWIFQGWGGDAAGTNATVSVAMTVDRSVTATFTQDFVPVEISDVVIFEDVYNAEVTWTTNVPASTKVAYGLTAAYELGEVTGAPQATLHGVTLTNLLPETTYQVRIFSEAEAGNTDSMDGLSFTTNAVTPSAVVSDDFSACSIDGGLWQVIDPKGDATIAVVGTGSTDARISISFPAGTKHDVWSNANDSARLMQPANNTDFVIAAKFDAPMSASYQMQGILVEQSVGTFLRFDFYGAGTNNYIYAAAISGSSVSVKKNMNIAVGSPLYMSITRAGDVWTQKYSYDGVTWQTSVTFTYAMTVTAVGPFVGNYNAAFTGLIDYFFNSASPIAPEDGPPAIPPTVLTTNVIGQGSIDADPDQTEFYCDETVVLSAIPTPGWIFDGWSGDSSATVEMIPLVMTADRSVTASFVPDLTPLVISDIGADRRVYDATITWNTSKPATSQVAYGLTDSYEVGTVGTSGYGTIHQVLLPSLDPATEYHFQVTSVDGVGNSESTTDLTFSTLVVGGFVSDDFNGYVVDPDVWTIVDPLGDATFTLTGTNTPDARLEIAVPGGTNHSIYGTVKNAPRIMQAAGDVDLMIEVKFESVLSQQYQEQGIIVEESAGTYIRFDFYSDGSNTHIFAAAFTDGANNVFRDSVVPSGYPWFMRVTRSGNQWTQAYSFTGTSWTTATTFNHSMSVTAVGPFVASEGGPAPAFTGIIDYFFTAENPVDPEDGGYIEDVYPPIISDIQTSVGATAADITWTTHEPANSRIDYGLTNAYELGFVTDGAFLFDHLLAIANLEPDTFYYGRVVAEDSSGNIGEAPFTFTTGPPGSSNAPDLALWYGAVQEFGLIGMPIPWVNILGNVSDTNGVTSLAYSLNGGPATTLAMGPDSRRLLKPGDFNVELAFDELPAGDNDLVISATDTFGNLSETTVMVVNSGGPVWPLPYSVDWSTVSQIQDVAQVVDGHWAVEADTVRPLAVGYDRLVAIGDLLWDDYEITVPIRVDGIDTSGYAPPSNGPAVGFVMRWPGHNGTARPRIAFYPLGAIGMFRWTQSVERFQIQGNNGVNLASASPDDVLEFGVAYYFKMQVRTSGSDSIYRLKVWEVGQAEPLAWKLTGVQANTAGPVNGSVLLLAHHVNASFGNVVITPVPSD